MDVLKDGTSSCPVPRLPAGDIENAVVGQLRVLLRAPEIIVQTWRVVRKVDRTITEAEVRDAIERLDPVWDELFPAEQARIVQLLVARVDVGPAGLDIHLRTEGLTTLVDDLRAAAGDTRRAA
jgi:site-specific DNA recombinase